MKPNYLRMLAIFSILSITLFATASHATMVMVSATDGNGSPTFFDPTSLTQSGANGEIIDLGLVDFIADGGSAVNFATDTLFMTLTAPDGMKITSISYSETGSGTTNDGFAAATGSMVVDGTPVNFLTQIFGANTSSGWSIDPDTVIIGDGGKTSIDLTITNSLVAFLFGAGPATIEKTGATLTVGLAAIPVPPAIWMMGAALTALITVGRRNRV